LITAATCSRGREEDDGGISVQTERPAESLMIRMAYRLRVNSSPREMVGRKRRGREKRKGITPEARGEDKETEERGGGERWRRGGEKEKEREKERAKGRA